jgi:hypothetical protein
MARTADGKRLTRMHTKQQLALRAKIVTEVMRLYALWELKDKASYARFQNSMVVVAQLRAIESATIAASYYELFRAVDAPKGAAGAATRVALAAAPSAEQIRAAVSATARAGVFRALRAGKPYDVAMQNGLVEVSGAVSRLALNGGRDTIEQAVMRDPQALGWARVASANACAFCAMLASRGPVYKEESVDFEAHDHCTCGSEPVYEGAEWPAGSKAYQDLWYENHGSYNDFRAAVEGRGQ